MREGEEIQKELEDLIKKGIKYSIIQERLKKIDPKTYESVEDAISQIHTKEVEKLIDEKVDNLVRKYIKHTLVSEIKQVIEELMKKKKWKEVLVDVLVISTSLIIGFSTQSLFNKYSTWAIMIASAFLIVGLVILSKL